MPSGVICSVSNCAFWEEGNRCAAKEIAIEIDRHSAGDGEFADELGEHRDRAGDSAATCCQTFRPKEREQGR